MVVDPRPRSQVEDTIVYQVPENSRAYELLIELLDEAGLEHVTIGSMRRNTRRKDDE
jgi:hypothetical protein